MEDAQTSLYQPDPGLRELQSVASQFTSQKPRNRFVSSRIPLKEVVGAAGLEPATLCLEGRCSILAELRARGFPLDSTTAGWRPLHVVSGGL